MYLGTFIAMSYRGNVHVWLGCTQMWSPEVSTVLHWQPPDVHIFGSDPSLDFRLVLMSVTSLEGNYKW